MANKFEAILKIPELRKRLLMTGLLLFVYRLGIFITCPGVDQGVMREYFSSNQGTVLGMFNLFSGGALENFSVFALGVMPYITSSIIMSLMAVVVPSLERMQKEGQQGRTKINQYSRYLTVALCLIQGLGVAFLLERMRSGVGEPVVSEPGWPFRLLTIVTLAAGTIFVMWLGEQITERGIGNGISLIIFAGIVSNFPDAVVQTWKFVQQKVIQPVELTVLLALMLAAIAFIIFFEKGQRRIPIQYAKRQIGAQVMGQSSHLPLKVNTAGVIPPIFASSLLVFPQTLTNFLGSDVAFVQKIQDFLTPGSVAYNTLFISLIIFFSYFYTAVMFNPEDVAESLRKNGGFVPGIRPGKQTADYLDRVISRITFAGAIYMSVICVLPSLLISRYNVPFYFGGTSLMIVVGVALDTVNQIESHMITRHYEGFSGDESGERIRARTQGA